MFRKPIFAVMLVIVLVAMACRAASQPERTPEPATISGEQLFQKLGCSNCHTGRAAVAAPSLIGLYGDEVRLESGDTVTANEDYLRESILSPAAKIVHGFQPIMPDFADKLTEEQLDALIEYIRSLSDQ